MTGWETRLLLDLLGGYVGLVAGLLVWLFVAAVGALLTGVVGGLGGLLVLAGGDRHVHGRVLAALDEASERESVREGHLDVPTDELPLSKRMQEHRLSQIVPTWTFLITYVGVVASGLIDAGWIGIAATGVGASFLTAVVVTWLVVYDRFPGALHPYAIARVLENIKLTVGVAVVTGVFFGSIWWFIREVFLYGLSGADRAVVAPEATAVAFWAVFPVMVIWAVCIGLLLVYDVVAYALGAWVKDAVARLTDEERRKLNLVEADLARRFRGPLYTTVLAVTALVALEFWQRVVGATLGIADLVVAWRLELAVGFEVVVMVMTLWSIYLSRLVGFEETTIRKLLKRQIAVFGTHGLLLILLVGILFVVVQPLFETALGISRARLAGPPQAVFSSEAHAVLADRAVATADLLAPLQDPPTVDARGMLRPTVQFVAPVAAITMLTPVLVSNLYFQGLTSIVSNLWNYFGFALLEVFVNVTWEGTLGQLPAVTIHSLVPVGISLLLVGGLDWYYEQLTKTPCEDCNEMVPADGLFCSVCGSELSHHGEA